MQKCFRIIFLVCCFVFSKQNFSQDIRGAWINYKYLSGYSYSITATIIVDSSSALSHTTTIYFGDGDSCTQSATISIVGKLRVFKFSCTHAYNGPGNYKIYCSDKHRINGIKNIGNSGTQSVYIENLLPISSFIGPNNSSTVGIYPISFSIPLGALVYHNPNITDLDGDSLSYSLTNCAGITPFSHYIPATANIDSYGVLSMHKDSTGIYVFAYLIKEWRKNSFGNWNLVGTTILDFVLQNGSGVGINEFTKEEKVKVYPNPTSNILSIKSNSKNNSEIEITNPFGQTVLKQNYSETIDVSNLNPGCYFIKIDNLYSKFIKE